MTKSSWPPRGGPTTINVPRSDATLTTLASIEIAAPAAQVFDALLSVEHYPQWNQFCPEVTIEKQPDGVPQDDKKLHLNTNFTLYAVMDAKKMGSKTPTQLRVTDFSTPDAPSEYVPKEVLEKDGSFEKDLGHVYRIAWKCEGGFAARGLRTERFHEVIDLNDEFCEVRTWEMQAGVLANAVKWMYRKVLDQKFQLWVEDLKKYCEQQRKTRSAST